MVTSKQASESVILPPHPTPLFLFLSLPPSLYIKVCWGDLEAAKEEQRKNEVGFCIGGGWSQLIAEELSRDNPQNFKIVVVVLLYWYKINYDRI